MQLNITLDDNVWEQLQTYCVGKPTNPRDLVRWMISKFLRQEETTQLKIDSVTLNDWCDVVGKTITGFSITPTNGKFHLKLDTQKANEPITFTTPPKGSIPDYLESAGKAIKKKLGAK